MMRGMFRPTIMSLLGDLVTRSIIQQDEDRRRLEARRRQAEKQPYEPEAPSRHPSDARFWRASPIGPVRPTTADIDNATVRAAEAKRARKAAKRLKCGEQGEGG